jgi:hydrogenase-4 component F
MLFLAAGNTLAYFQTKSTLQTRGIRRALPVTGAIWVIGVLSITGSPPFGTFLSEFTVLKEMIDADRLLVAIFYLVALATVFVAMTATVIPMVYGKPEKREDDSQAASLPPASSPGREPLWSVVPPLLLGLAVLVLGLYVPQGLSDLLHRAAMAVGAE